MGNLVINGSVGAGTQAPIISAIPDRSFIIDTGPHTVDLSSYVIGGDPVTSYTATGSGFTQVGSVLTFDNVLGSGTVTWYASNAGGNSATDVFDFQVVETPAFRASMTVPDGRTYPAGTGLPTMVEGTNFTVADEPSVASDTILVTIPTLSDTEMKQTEHYQVEVDLGGSTQVRDVPHGAGADSFPHRFFGRQDASATPIRFRAIMSDKNLINVLSNTTISVGNIVTTDSGFSAEVIAKGVNNNTEDFIVVKNPNQQPQAGEDLKVGGTTQTQVHNQLLFLSSFVIENVTAPIYVNDILTDSINDGNGSFFVQRVQHISGTTGGGDWKGMIHTYAETGNSPNNLTGRLQLGMDIHKGGVKIGNAADYPLRSNYDYKYWAQGSLVKEYGPWSSWANVTCTYAAPSVTVTTHDGKGLVAGEAAAPAALMMKIEAKGFSVINPIHDLHYKTTSTDTWTMQNLPSDGKNQWASLGAADGTSGHVSYAKEYAAIGFPTAGTHTVSATVTSEVDRTTATGQVNVVIDNPSTFDAVWTVGPGRDKTTLQVALQDVNSLGAGASARLELDGAVEHSTWEPPTQAARLQIAAMSGTGRPKITTRVEHETGGVSEEFTMHGIEVSRGYDPDGYNASEPPDCITMIKARGCRASFIDVISHEGDVCIDPVPPYPQSGHDTSTGPGRGITLVVDSNLTDWYNFGMFAGESAPIGISGVVMAQSDKCMQERPYQGESGHRDMEVADGAHSASADHGPFRFSRVHGNEWSFDRLWMFSNSGWGGGTDGTQECKRFNEGGNWPYQFSYTRVYEEGKPTTFTAGTNPGKKQQLLNIAADGYIVMGTWSIGSMIRIESGGMSYKNVLQVLPDMWASGSNAISVGLQLGKTEWEGDHTLWLDGAWQRTNVYNYTIIDLRSNTNMSDQQGDLKTFTPFLNVSDGGGNESLKNYDIRNTLLYRPNDTADLQTTDTPLEDTPAYSPYFTTHQMWACQEITFDQCDGYMDLKMEIGSATGDRDTPTRASADGSGSGSGSLAYTYAQNMQVTGGSIGSGTGTGWAMIESRPNARTSNVNTPLTPLQVNDIVYLDNGKKLRVASITATQSQPMSARTVDSNGCCSWRPETGNPAIGSATGQVPVTDIWGKTRPVGSASRGAAEP